jgi:hypothetical protein
MMIGLTLLAVGLAAEHDVTGVETDPAEGE